MEYDRRYESQDQPQRPNPRARRPSGHREAREIDHSHPYYGPDAYDMERYRHRPRPYRAYGQGDNERADLDDQPRLASMDLEPHGFWDNLRDYFGVGPKNYTRSDAAIYEEASEALRRHPGVDASRIELAIADGVASLRGEVPSREMKYEAEDTVEWIRGVTRVKSDLRVASRPRNPQVRDYDGQLGQA